MAYEAACSEGDERNARGVDRTWCDGLPDGRASGHPRRAAPDGLQPDRAESRKVVGKLQGPHRANTRRRCEYLNITPQVEECLRASGIREGLCLVNAMHITASVFINDNESGLHQDFETWLEKLAPEKPHAQYRHNGFEDNADAHLKRQIMGREVVVAITNGRLDFGPWEQIFYGEFDGMRDKRLLIKLIGE